MTPPLSRVPPLTPRLSCVAGAALGDSLELRLLDAVDAAAVSRGELLDAVCAVDAIDAPAVSLGRRGT